jgi:hypothetical protein
MTLFAASFFIKLAKMIEQRTAFSWEPFALPSLAFLARIAAALFPFVICGNIKNVGLRWMP